MPLEVSKAAMITPHNEYLNNALFEIPKQHRLRVRVRVRKLLLRLTSKQVVGAEINLSEFNIGSNHARAD